MRPAQLAEKYMDCFFGKTPLSSMEALLAEDLIFNGPWHEYSSAKAYLAALIADPPKNASYKMLKVFEEGNSVCFIYLFIKRGVETTMAQVFEIKDRRISKINLIFDTSAFSRRGDQAVET